MTDEAKRIVQELHSWNVFGQSLKRCNTELDAANLIEHLSAEQDALVLEIEKLRKERKHGTWIKNKYGLYDECDCAECSKCGDAHILDEWSIDDFVEYYKFCPNCGAKMDGGAE